MKAKKYDGDKAPITMIPRSAIEAEAMVMKFGAAKYGRDNWRKGMDHTRLLDAAMRHILAVADGEDLDPESGLPHEAHARCCLAMLIEYKEKGLGNDDRKEENKPQCMGEVLRLPEDVRSTLQPEITPLHEQFEFNFWDSHRRSTECDASEDR